VARRVPDRVDVVVREGGAGVAEERSRRVARRDRPERAARRGRGHDDAVDHGRDVGGAEPDVHAHAGGFPDAVQRRDGLLRDVQTRDVERLEHELRQPLAIRLGREQRLRDQRRALLALDPTALLVEDMTVDRLQGVPVRHRAVDDHARRGDRVAGGVRGEADGRGREHAWAVLRVRVPGSDEVVVVVDDDDVFPDRGRHDDRRVARATLWGLYSGHYEHQ